MSLFSKNSTGPSEAVFDTYNEDLTKEKKKVEDSEIGLMDLNHTSEKLKSVRIEGLDESFFSASKNEENKNRILKSNLAAFLNKKIVNSVIVHVDKINRYEKWVDKEEDLYEKNLESINKINLNANKNKLNVGKVEELNVSE